MEALTMHAGQFLGVVATEMISGGNYCMWKA